MACFSGRARLPPSHDVTIPRRLLPFALLREPISAIPLNQPDPSAPLAARREPRPPIRCRNSREQVFGETPSTQYSVLSTRYSVLGTQYSALGTRYSILRGCPETDGVFFREPRPPMGYRNSCVEFPNKLRDGPTRRSAHGSAKWVYGTIAAAMRGSP